MREVEEGNPSNQNTCLDTMFLLLRRNSNPNLSPRFDRSTRASRLKAKRNILCSRSCLGYGRFDPGLKRSAPIHTSLPIHRILLSATGRPKLSSPRAVRQFVTIIPAHDPSSDGGRLRSPGLRLCRGGSQTSRRGRTSGTCVYARVRVYGLG